MVISYFLLVNKKNLVNLGCCVDVAQTGEQALEMAVANPYNIIFMDVGLPGISGIETTVTIRRHHESLAKHTPIIGLTAYSDEQTQKECKAAGMDEVIIKPVEPKQLEELLIQFC